MLATVGYIATEFIHLPGAVYNVSPIAAHNAAVASGECILNTLVYTKLSINQIIHSEYQCLHTLY